MNSASDRIHAALLDYFDAPGKYPIGSRQPEVLFDAIDEILLLAAGRTPAKLGSTAEGLRDAAAFFIGAALLYPGADHYTLLGLTSQTAPLRLKERYRLLMRVIHPDFAASVRANWPKDSAMRVNRAYEVLSSPVLRREYDGQLAGTSVHHRSGGSHAPRRVSPASLRPKHAPRLRIGKAAAWTCIVLLGLMAIGMLLPHRGPVGVVQRPNMAAGSFTKAALAIDTEPIPERALDSNDTIVVPPPVPVGADASVVEVSPSAPNAEVRPYRFETKDATASAQPVRPTAAPVQATAPPPPAPAIPTTTPTALARVIEMPVSGGLEARSTAVPPATPTQTPSAAATALEAAAPIRVSAVRSRVVPTLADVQPFLGHLLQSLESGRSDQLVHLLDAEARYSATAQGLARRYERIVGRAGQVKLSHAEFTGEPREDLLVVTGTFRLQVGESTIGSQGERLVVRATFESRGGRVALIGLSGVTE